MRIAFYAPMKPPDHPLPSGDRRMARSFMALAQRALATRSSWPAASGATTEWRPARQQRLEQLGGRLARATHAALARSAGTGALVHLPPLSQGTRLAGAGGLPTPCDPLCRRRGLARAKRAAVLGRRLLCDRRRDRAGRSRAGDDDQRSAGPAKRRVAPSRLALFPPFLDAAPFASEPHPRQAQYAAAARGRDDARR